ncbi:MAG: cellulose synthase subunit BcsC-related outer membrane protein [Acetobacteraceae bacterium]
MIRRIAHSTALLIALGGFDPAQAQAQPDRTLPNAAAKVLLDQANYWYEQRQPEEAQQAIDRLLRLDPTNVSALAMQAQLQAERGERTAAQATLAKLRTLQPDSPRIAAIEQAIRFGSIDTNAVAEARRLAREGRRAEAVARYQRLFRGSEPPANLAAEYYETLAGTEGGLPAALNGLKRVVTANPGDTLAQLSYARLLTYQEATRLEGIRRLASLAQSKGPDIAAAANNARRQALDWLPVDQDSVPSYQAWLSDHPDDPMIKARLEQARNPPRSPDDIAGAERSDAFKALNSGNLKAAETAFQSLIDQNPRDADALGGLGLVRLRQGQLAAARDLLSRAIAADPAHKDRWEQALAGANAGEDYAAATAAMQRGQLDTAERLLRTIIARGGDIAGAQAMLADVLRRRGDLAGAETLYRTVLGRQPNNADAMVGLAQVLNRQGRSDEADALMQRAQAQGNGRLVGRIRADALRQQASETSDPVAKEALLRAAMAAAPSDPWTRLDLARALAARGRTLEAQQVMLAVTSAANPSVDAIRAAALFDAEQGRMADAAALIARLPAGARTAEMRSLLARAKLDSEIRNIAGLAAISPVAAREKLLTLAAQPDPDGTRGVAIARAFLQMGRPAGAREALATAQAATPSPTAAQRIAYAGMLLQAGDERGAQIMIHALDGARGLTSQQVADLNRLRAGAAIRESDRLNAEGRQADAYDVLAPALARDPGNPDLNMAVARLYAHADEPRKALAINQALLARDPDNFTARQAALDAAIQLGDWSRSELLVREALRIAPDDPRAWMMSAALARARGNMKQALQDLQRARTLRRDEASVAAPAPLLADDPPAGASRRSAPASLGIYRTTSNQETMPRAANPFRRESRASSRQPDSDDFLLPQPMPSDPMLRDIDKQIASIRQDLAPKFTVGPSVRSRTGTTGLDQLNELRASMELLSRPLGYGKLSVAATPTFLSAGEVPGDTNSQLLFGTGAFGNRPAPSSQQAQGVGLSAAYELGWFRADVGSSPIGFQQTNVIGGVELSPQLADGTTLRLRGERRSVTDSVLSYAGTKDPSTGIAWGGVTRTRGHAQLELSIHGANFYAGGGYAVLDGVNVASNTQYELGLGGSYPIWSGQDNELRVGLDLVYFSYDKNLRYFTLGQGGYFSPQSYFAALIPLRYTAKSDDLTWSIGGALGYQTYNEHASPVFPNDAGLQSALVASAATTPGLQTVYPGKSAAGLVGNAEGAIEYRLTDQVRLGGRAAYQHAGNWSEFMGALFARYIFDH